MNRPGKRHLHRSRVPRAAWLLAVAASACQEGLGATVGPRSEYAAIPGVLEPFIRREMADKHIPAISIALVDGRDVVWAAGFGYADLADSTLATAETPYRLGSVTKLVTAIAVMQQVEEGTLDLDAPVSRLIEGFQPRNPFDRPLTVRHLLSHRAGLVREPPAGGYFDSSRTRLRDAVLSLNGTTLVAAPGSRLKYSDAGMTVAGHLVERVTGLDFAAAAQASVLDRAGLSHSGFARDSSTKASQGWLWSYDGRDRVAPTFQVGAPPAAGLHSTAGDLARLVAILLDSGRTRGKPLLQGETIARMWNASSGDSTAARDFGLGFRIIRQNGMRIVGHISSFDGYSADISIIPGHRLAAIVIANKEAASAVVSRLSSTALTLMLAARSGASLPSLRSTQPLKPGLAKQLDGTYRSAVRGRAQPVTVELEERHGRLFFHRAGAEHWLEVRSLGDTLITDDRLGYGDRIGHSGSEIVLGTDTLRRTDVPRPPDVTERWRGLIGEYGPEFNPVYVREEDGRLHLLVRSFFDYPLREESPGAFRLPDYGLHLGEAVAFQRSPNGKATAVVLGGAMLRRRAVAPEDGSTFKIVPLRPAEVLVREALASTPPRETGDFLAPDFVEVARLDPTIKLDMRYATTNNFVSTAFYKEGRAFLQRPAAEALVRANQRLRPLGYGLLVHDSYRPWYVTKMFWDATPEDKRMFVANPANGSRHNRGCAIDLTLYDLKTGRPIQMVSGYDEFSDRAYPDYPGGTSLQRWHRKLLRRAMEAEGFTVFNTEWWHFDYRDWRKYPISNLRFEEIGS